MAKVLCVLYDDPSTATRSYARDTIPVISSYPGEDDASPGHRFHPDSFSERVG